MMQHLDEGTIHSWLDGALSADEAAHLEAHVAECPQCAAAVAEARGFIAASSRILTALDHVPRGVVPAAPPARWSNRAVWRAAAAVLVVAAGSLVVFRNGGNDMRLMTATADSSRSGAKVTLDTGSIRAAPTGVAASERAVALQKTPPAMAPRSTYSGKATAAIPQPNIPVRENRRAAEQAGRGVAEGNAAPSAYTGGAAPTAQTLAQSQSRVAGVTVMDATGEPTPLKVVRVEAIVGGTRTLYEVSPSDTVILIEPQQARLEAVATSAAGAVTAQSVEKSAAAKQRARVDMAVTSTPDSQQASAQAARAAPTMLAPAAAPQPTAGLASPIHTIRWTDAATGKMLTLSGRLPEAQLQQIRFRIERERAATAAKKKP